MESTICVRCNVGSWCLSTQIQLSVGSLNQRSMDVKRKFTVNDLELTKADVCGASRPVVVGASHVPIAR
jgi:hypothetical protein